MRRFMRRTGLALVCVCLALAGLALVTIRSADPFLYPPGADMPGIRVVAVDHGYHAGLIVPVSQLRVVASLNGNVPLLSLTQRFAAYEWLEIGWGDENFYRNVPDLSFGTTHHVIKALFWPDNSSILHVVGFSGQPEEVFFRSRQVSLRLGNEGFARLAKTVGDTFAESGGSIVDVGPGLYGPSLFFKAKGSYSLLNLCNHWTGKALASAGVPYSPVLSTLSAGLMADLRWRALRRSR
jgi:uncharacterized protein (TIGR02117 family)